MKFHTLDWSCLDQCWSMDNEARTWWEIRNQLTQLAFLITHIILTAVVVIITSVYANQPELYHTSIFTSQGWVLELLTGHPERICCELKLHHHVFIELISKLHGIGYCESMTQDLFLWRNSWLFFFISVLLAWQFVMPASISRDPMRQFQSEKHFNEISNSIISRYFRQMLDIFLSPFYINHVCLPTEHDPIPT